MPDCTLHPETRDALLYTMAAAILALGKIGQLTTLPSLRPKLAEVMDALQQVFDVATQELAVELTDEIGGRD